MSLKPFCQLIWASSILLGIWASQATTRNALDEASMAYKHDEWAVKFGRHYKNNTEKMARFKIFKKNVEYITAFNKAGAKPYKLGLNQFTDMTNVEFKASLNGYKKVFRSNSSKVPTNSSTYAELSVDIPRSKNWVKEGAVNGILNQGRCGACWAFSAVAAIEGIYKIKTEYWKIFSKQELIDCNKGYRQNSGCGGGNAATAFEFVMEHGLTTEDNYPYQEADGTCDTTRITKAVTIKGYGIVEPNNERELLKAVARQPISVGIDGEGYHFQHYSSGVFNGPCGTDLTHAVPIVGYGEDEHGTKYWLVKNSYGIDWGETGFMRLKRDIDAAEGLCGIAIDASYPIM